jgi:uncharacterized linocin/CFP29 family protein
MADYLMRDDAPFSAEQWAAIDDLVVRVARQLLVGRRFIEITGPLGIGVPTVPLLTIGEGDPIEATEQKHLGFLLLHQDFRLGWRDIETSHKLGLPMELGPAAAASAAVARLEDELVFRGHAEHGYEGLLNAQGRNTVDLADWGEPGSAFENIVAATEALVGDGFYGPFAVILSPARYAQTQRIARGMGRLESKLIKGVAEGGFFRTPALAADQGLVVALGAHNLDLVVAQDLVTAYLGPENMDHTFRLLESLVLRIKRPGAICTLEA